MPVPSAPTRVEPHPPRSNHLVISGVSKRFGTTIALDDVSLALAESEQLALLGPSGCGKTTLLRVVAGLEGPDAGTVRIAGETMVGPERAVPAEKRRVGMVFQDWALFPHLTVRRNVGYGLSRDQIARGRIQEALAMVGLAGHGERYPHELSAGQAQRVALARALAPRPRVLLFDEAFSNLDTELRVKLRADVSRLMRDVGMTSAFVTHDQEEAFVLGDRVAVMREGRILQIDRPAEVYRSPASPWVARFVGEANLVEGDGDGATASTPLGSVPVTDETQGRCRVLIRPEHLALDEGGDGIVDLVEFYGHDTAYRIRLDGRQFLARDIAAPRFERGDSVSLRYRGPAANAYPAESVDTA